MTTDAVGDVAEPDVVTVAIGDYLDVGRHPPFDADAQAVEIAELLVRDLVGGRVRPWSVPPEGRHRGAVDARVLEWADPGAYVPGSVLVWVGHGHSDGDRAATLAVRGADVGSDGRMRDATYSPTDLAQALVDWRRRQGEDDAWAVVVIEACGAGRFVELVSAELELRRSVKNVLLVGVGDPDGPGFAGQAGQALARVVSQFGLNDSEISLSDLGDRIARQLPGGSVRTPDARRAVIRRPTTPVTASMDVYAKLAAAFTTLPAAERAHFARKGMGADFGELTWNFVGRTREIDEIVRWTRETGNGLLVVTGRAGAGKSAILGNVVLRSRPALWSLLQVAGSFAEDELPAPRVDATVHLTGMRRGDVLAAVRDQVQGLPPPFLGEADADLALARDTTAVVDALASRRDALVLVADALDESAEPRPVADLLRRLSEVEGVRVAVGTRQSTQEGPDLPDPSDRDLLDALRGPATRELVVMQEPGALREYVRAQLHGVADDAALERVAGRLTSHVDGRPREFLFARLLVTELRAVPSLLGPAGADDLERLLAGDHRGLFAAAVRRLAAGHGATPALLEALAHGQGRGLPRADRLWAVASSAIAEGDVSDDDVDVALRDAAAFILVDAEDGSSVFRLAHRTFQEHFLALPGSGDRAWAVLEALSRRAEELHADAGAAGLSPYLVRRLPDHARACGLPGWARLAAVEGLGVGLDPGALSAAALGTACSPTQLPPAVQGIVLAAHDLVRVDSSQRPGLIDLALHRLGLPPLSASGHPEAAWRSPSAAMPRVMLHRVLTGHTGWVRGVAVFPGADGRPRLATTSWDGTVRVWDPQTGTPDGPALTGHTDGVTGVAVFTGVDGRPRLATSSWDGTVRVWDPQTGTQDGPALTGHTGSVWGVAVFPGADGRPRLATTSDDRTVRVWDPQTGTQDRPALTGHTRGGDCCRFG